MLRVADVPLREIDGEREFHTGLLEVALAEVTLLSTVIFNSIEPFPSVTGVK